MINNWASGPWIESSSNPNRDEDLLFVRLSLLPRKTDGSLTALQVLDRRVRIEEHIRRLRGAEPTLDVELRAIAGVNFP
jgi:hypothetical protein